MKLSILFQFLSHDIPLFQGIISDLFPGVELPEADYGDLEEALIEHIKKRQLQPDKWFIEKMIQVNTKSKGININQVFYCTQTLGSQEVN